MEVLKLVPYYLLIPVVALFVNITTEFAANVATATLFLPIVAEVAMSIGQHPLLLMIPATFSCNYSFILPIATPPNAVAHSTGYTKPVDMILPGFVLKVVGVAFLSVFTPTLGMRPLAQNLNTSNYFEFSVLSMLPFHAPHQYVNMFQLKYESSLYLPILGNNNQSLLSYHKVASFPKKIPCL